MFTGSIMTYGIVHLPSLCTCAECKSSFICDSASVCCWVWVLMRSRRLAMVASRRSTSAVHWASFSAIELDGLWAWGSDDEEGSGGVLGVYVMAGELMRNESCHLKASHNDVSSSFHQPRHFRHVGSQSLFLRLQLSLQIAGTLLQLLSLIRGLAQLLDEGQVVPLSLSLGCIPRSLAGLQHCGRLGLGYVHLFLEGGDGGLALRDILSLIVQLV